jgi:hypothetical protein
MKNIKNTILAAFALLAANVMIAQTYKADVAVTVQEQNEWCWVANSRCVLAYYGTTKKQCEIAEYARTLNTSTYGTTACCSSPSGKCNNPNELQGNGAVQGMLSHFGNIQSTVSSGAIAVSKIQSELGARRPFIIGIFWSGGGGHVVVGCMYSGSNLTFMDPWQNNGMTTYKYTSGTSVVTSTGTGTWHETLVITTPYTPTGIADAGALAKDVTVYPNPSEGQLNIQSTYNVKTVNVFNATGQLVYSHAVNGDKNYSLNIPVAGFYNVQVVTENGSAYKKVVIGSN